MNDFSEYKKMKAPDKRQRAENWGIAIGLQAVDGLTPSKYLYKIARDNIEGKISMPEVYKHLDEYQKTPEGKAEGADKWEANRVSAHITEILADQSFTFAPTTLTAIHDRLFYDVYPDIAGRIRKFNITKDEDILGGDTVQYGTALTIMDTLKYDFDNEKHFDYAKLSRHERAEHIVKFISDIWQTHPFAEGNTRTIAVFAIKYLRALGYTNVGNEQFEKHAKYFRNALVRANYQNLERDIPRTMEYLNLFFANLLLDESNELRNSDMQVGAKKESMPTKTRDKILELIAAQPKLSATEMATELKLSPETIRDHLARMKADGIIEHTGPAKGGQWKTIKPQRH